MTPPVVNDTSQLGLEKVQGEGGKRGKGPGEKKREKNLHWTTHCAIVRIQQEKSDEGGEGREGSPAPKGE